MIIRNTYILRKIGGDYVIIPTGTTPLEFNGMITVNEQGAFIWEQLTSETTREALIDAVLSEYEVDRDTAGKDVDDFLSVLRQCRILSE